MLLNGYDLICGENPKLNVLKMINVTDMKKVGIPFGSMFGGGRGGAYTHQIPVLTKNFDENALLDW